MINARNSFLTLALLACATSGYAAAIRGTVKGPDAAALEGVLVQAQNKKTNMTFIVLSNHQGAYHIEKLAAGDYTLSTKITGYRGDAPIAVNLRPDETALFDMSLKKIPVRWNEVSIYQAGKLWPASPAKDQIFSACFACHGFQTRMASVQRDLDGWRSRVLYMRIAMKFGLEGRVSDQQAEDIAAYLTSLFGEDSVLPKSPEQAAGYKDTVRPLSGDAMNIQFVEYDMPAPGRMPFSAAPDKDGYFWIPNCGVANRISRLDPNTGAIQDFLVPNNGPAVVHSAVPAADGSVWLTEQASNKLGQWDPQTQAITEFPDAYLPGKLGVDAGSKHTLRFDFDGNIWATGNPLIRLDRKTKKITRFDEILAAYDVKADNDGNMWFTRPDTSQIGMVDRKTQKITLWMPPTPRSFPRRMQIDTDGIVWFGEFNSGKMGRFDPKTQKFTEYPLPGPEATPYGLEIDADHQIWYSSYNMDVLGRFDPKTGKTVEYPFPRSENAIRELIRDSQGRIWYASPSHDKVGYFTLTAGDEHSRTDKSTAAKLTN